MSLDETQKKLYGKEEPRFEDRPAIPKNISPTHQGEDFNREQWEKLEKKNWQPFSSNNKKIIIWGSLIALLFVAAAASVFLWRTKYSFDQNKVSFSLFGPERIESGEEITYTIKYENNSDIELQNVRLILDYPNGSFSIDSDENKFKEDLILSNIVPHSQGQHEFKIRLTGLKGDMCEAKAKLIYRPSNIPNENFEKNKIFSTTIVSVPIKLSFSNLPDRVTHNQDLDIILTYNNDSNGSFSNLFVKIDYPFGFSYKAALPEPSESNNIWKIDSLSPQEEGKIVISGEITGQSEESKMFRAQIGTKKDSGELIILSEISRSSLVAFSPLRIWQKVNEQEIYVASCGETLKYKIQYKNTTNESLSSVVVTVKVDSPALDLTKLKVDKGSFESYNNTITWNSYLNPDLAILSPGQEGELSFSVKVKDHMPINNYTNKNFIIVTEAKIDTPKVPLSLVGTKISGESTLEVKVNTKLSFKASVYYNDSLIKNSGPTPPKIEQTTTYTVHWQIINESNDIENVEVHTYLPIYIKWLNNFSPSENNLKYDSATGKLTWKIEKVAAQTGILTPSKQIAFQIGFTPSVNQLNQSVDILNNSFLNAKDSFTGTDLSIEVKGVKTNLPDDPDAGGKVMQ